MIVINYLSTEPSKIISEVYFFTQALEITCTCISPCVWDEYVLKVVLKVVWWVYNSMLCMPKNITDFPDFPDFLIFLVPTCRCLFINSSPMLDTIVVLTATIIIIIAFCNTRFQTSAVNLVWHEFFPLSSSIQTLTLIKLLFVSIDFPWYTHTRIYMY